MGTPAAEAEVEHEVRGGAGHAGVKETVEVEEVQLERVAEAEEGHQVRGEGGHAGVKEADEVEVVQLERVEEGVGCTSGETESSSLQASAHECLLFEAIALICQACFLLVAERGDLAMAVARLLEGNWLTSLMRAWRAMAAA